MLALVAFLVGVAVTLMHRPWSQIETGDEAIWDYMAQAILRGQVPYREVIEIKTPGSAYLSALAMLVGRSIGVRDVIAVRLLYVLMMGLLAAITFIVAEVYLRNRIAALIAFLFPLASWHFAEWMAAGTEPKLPMILFGMLSVLLLALDKPFWAGFCSMLSCLCWQPGLLFTGTLLLISSRYLTSWRDLRALKVLLGALVPLAIMLVYFYSIGALKDLWNWTVTYNYAIYAHETIRGFDDALAHLWRVLLRVFRLDIILVALSLIGMAMFGFECVRAELQASASASRDIFRTAILIPPIVYLAFCLINFQSGPDLIPLFPFMGLFAGSFFVDASRMAGASRVIGARAVGRAVSASLPVIVLVFFLGLILSRSVISAFEPRPKLRDQYIGLKVVASQLGSDGEIYVHGTVDILVLLNRPNMTPYVFLDRGKDNYIAAKKPGGFKAMIDELESRAPKIVALSRLAKVIHRAELEDWVGTHYDKLEVPGYEGIFVRKQQF